MEKITIEKHPVTLWNNSGEDFYIILKAFGLEYRLDMETAYLFARFISVLGCGTDPFGYDTEDLETTSSVSLDLICTNLFIRDSVCIEKQLDEGCCLTLMRYNSITEKITKDYLYLDEQECDYICLKIIEL